MEQPSAIGSMLQQYERGHVSRRQFIEAVTALTATAAVAPSLAAQPPAHPLQPVSVNHIAIGVSDIARSKAWYQRLLQLKTIQENEHFALLQFGDTQLVLRTPTKEHPSTAVGTISHVMFGVAPYDEEALRQNLLAQGLTPKKDLESFLIRDPDNLIVQVGDEKMGLNTGYPPAST